MNSYEQKNPWFKNGRCIIHPSREVCRKKFISDDKSAGEKPARDWIIRMNRRGWLSTQLLRLYCARRFSFRAFLLTPIALILVDLLIKQYYPENYINIWGDASAGLIAVVILFIVFIFIVAGKEVKKFEDSVRNIVEVCELSPATFPKTPEEFQKLINGSLIEFAWIVLWCELKGESKDRDRAAAKTALDKLYKSADALGLFVRSSYHYYYTEATRTHTLPGKK